MEEKRTLSAAVLDHRQLEELLGSGGLKAPRWRARVAAAERAARPFSDKDWEPCTRLEGCIKYYELLLPQLVHGLALQDPQWQVRVAAVESATTILTALRQSLSESLNESIWGILATCLDPQPEVQQAAMQCVLKRLIPSSSEVLTAIQTLFHSFVAVSVRFEDLQIDTPNPSKHSGQKFVGLENVPNGEVLLAGITAATSLQLLPLPGLSTGPSQSKTVDIVPLLLLIVGVALEDSRRRNSRVLVKGLTRFLRCAGKGIYRRSLLAMFNPKSAIFLPGMNLVKTYVAAGMIDDETATALRTSKLSTVLNAVSIALEPLDDGFINLPIYIAGSENTGTKMSFGQEEITALQQVMEMIQVPSVLTGTLKDAKVELESLEFLQISSYSLNILKSIVENKLWVNQRATPDYKLVEELILCCATFAGGEEENVGTVLWTSEEHRELSLGLLVCISESLHPHSSELLIDDGLENLPSQRISILVLESLPSVLPRLKQVIKGNPGMSGEDPGYANGSVETAVIAAHQMEWCLRQLRHPNLGQNCSLVMPCILTALDHFSPEVKRRAMRAVIHLAKNMNPTELRWYKDVLLDAVCRSLAGSGDNWAVAVKMAVKTVTCCEGSNPRGSWYRQILAEMLGEVERQRDNEACRVSWLEEIAPQMEAMGLVLVAHFRRLLPLLYYWLHAPDDRTCLLTLARLNTLIVFTWPRIPAHMKRITEEVVNTYYASHRRKMATDVQNAVVEVLNLLHSCGGQEIEEALQENRERLNRTDQREAVVSS